MILKLAAHSSIYSQHVEYPLFGSHFGTTKMIKGIWSFPSAYNVIVLSRKHTLFSICRNVCMCTVQDTAVKDQQVWWGHPFVPVSLGNQTQAQSWRIEHLQLAQMQLWDADLQRAKSVQPHPPVPSDPLSFACSTRDCRQQRGPHKDKPHRALRQAAGSLCGDAILFPLQQMSALLPLPSSSRLCVFFHFSLEIPPVQDVFYFTFEKAEALLRAWVTSSRPNAAVPPWIFASGSLHLARGALLCAVTPAAGPAVRRVEPTSWLRRGKLLLHSDHLPGENSWLHTWKKWLTSSWLGPHTSRAEKKLCNAVFPSQGLKAPAHPLLCLCMSPLPFHSHPLLPMPVLIRARIHWYLKIALSLLPSPYPLHNQSREGQSDWITWASKVGLSQDSPWPEQDLGFKRPVTHICLHGKTLKSHTVFLALSLLKERIKEPLARSHREHGIDVFLKTSPCLLNIY